MGTTPKTSTDHSYPRWPTLVGQRIPPVLGVREPAVVIGGHIGPKTRYFHYASEGDLILEESFNPADPWCGLSIVESGRQAAIVGRSSQMLELFKDVVKLSDSRVWVFLQGPSGSGKEMIARALAAKKKPLIAMNCAGLSGNLLESELFGHVKGAFTGATEDRQGRFRAADGGTLFMDEIGDMPLPLQAKLLRALQHGAITPVGSDTEIQVDLRILSASNKDLASLVAQKAFREDLYYRINVVTLELPALRDRKEDIPLLAAYWLLRHRAPGERIITGIQRDALHKLCAYAWPGNVRQLKNTIAGAVALGEGPVLRAEELHIPMLSETPVPPESSRPTNPKTDNPRRRQSQKEIEQIRELIGQSPGATARQLAQLAGTSCRTIERKLQCLERHAVRAQKDEHDARLIRYYPIAR